MLWWGGKSVVWVSMTAVVGGVGRWRVVFEWSGEVRDWRRFSTTDCFGLSELVEEAVKLCGDVGGLNEKGRPAAERILCSFSRKCRREATWD